VLADGTVWGSSSKRPYRAPFGALWAVLGSSAKYLSKSPCKDLSNWYGGSCLAPLHINGGSPCEYPHTGGQVHVPPQAERGRDFTGLVEAVQCSCTSMAQCMRHAPLDIFTASCLDMHGEYILTLRRNDTYLLCYDVPENIRENAPQHIKDILTTYKYLGVPSNAQLDGKEGRAGILKSLHQRIGLISSKAQSITEAKIAHNIIVCQVATFSPICISFTLQEYTTVDRQLVKAYQYRLCHRMQSTIPLFLRNGVALAYEALLGNTLGH
jgi:hypothetical protein